MSYQDAYQQNWKHRLQHSMLGHFSQLWTIKADWFEEPNIRRGGWSGVIKVPLDSADTNSPNLFIKRQENHISRTWRHPILGIPTFQKEYLNLRLFHRYDIPTQEWIYYGSRASNGSVQAILITKELAGFYPLDVVLPSDNMGLIQSRQHRKSLLSAVARAIQKMHCHSMQHNSLYPKHIFVKPLDNGWDVRFIDLEKAKRRIFKHTAVVRDLGTFRRYTLDWTTREQVYFFKAYVDETRLSSRSKKLWYRIQERIAKKSK